MKKINVIVSSKTTLILDQDGQKGDYIDLTSLSEIDYTIINKMIDEGKDQVYQQRLNAYRQDLENLHKLDIEKIRQLNNSEIKQLNSQQDLNQKELELKYQDQITKLEFKYQQELSQLKERNQNITTDYDHKLEIININHQQDLTKLTEQIKNFKDGQNQELELIKARYQQEIDKLTNQLTLNQELEKVNLNKIQNQLMIEKEQLVNQLTQEFENRLREKEDEIRNLNYLKSVKNVKQTGEDLESWCDYEVRSYLENGFENCTWEKDNVVKKEDGETKGSKADFIFKVYAYNPTDNQNLLTSICLEMKDENPDSVNKRRNEEHYKALDNNRRKKNCKYALLVSNLELDKVNIPPIYKVKEYPDMYVVRPGYLMTFLNLIVSLTNKFKDLLLQIEAEKIELKSSLELIEQFDELKKRYLEKPLEQLQKEIMAIRKASNDIRKASEQIDLTCNRISEKYVLEILQKLERFEIKKLTKKLPALENKETK